MSGTRDESAFSSAAATRIRVLAAERNLKQADVADAAGIPRSTFGRYWRDERSMTIDDLESILKVLGTDYAKERPEIVKLQGAGD